MPGRDEGTAQGDIDARAWKDRLWGGPRLDHSGQSPYAPDSLRQTHLKGQDLKQGVLLEGDA
jgi:hypothetical protein